MNLRREAKITTPFPPKSNINVVFDAQLYETERQTRNLQVQSEYSCGSTWSCRTCNKKGRAVALPGIALRSFLLDRLGGSTH
jgi:hypothetical protein